MNNKTNKNKEIISKIKSKSVTKNKKNNVDLSIPVPFFVIKDQKLVSNLFPYMWDKSR